MRRKSVHFTLFKRVIQIMLSLACISALFIWVCRDSSSGDALASDAPYLYATDAEWQTAYLYETGVGWQTSTDTPSSGDLPPVLNADELYSGKQTPIEGIEAFQYTDDIIGVNDILFQPETDAANAELSANKEAVTAADQEKLYDFEYLRSQFYLVDADTGLLPSDIDMNRFLNGNLNINNTGSGPKILIFHTHSNEMYRDSNPNDPMDGIMGVGNRLAELLTTAYGIETLHHTGRYDIVDGKSRIPGAYERMEPDIEQLLRDNPSIEMVVDIHRDGLREGVPPMVTDINGKRTARIMFVNGLCRIRSNGTLVPVSGLENPYITDNLALSFRLQLTANSLYPEFTRKLYLKAYRYSLNMLPKSILVEVGAQNNTKQEAINAAEPLAEIIARVVLQGTD